MIISASRRTDILAYYSQWFFNRLKEGYLTIKNPYNPKYQKNVSLLPKDVEIIVFWSKNPKSLLDKLHLLNDYHYYIHFTVNAYGKELEPNIPELNEAIKTFKTLSEKIGPTKIIWRYDPIILTSNLNLNYHFKNFDKIASQLSGYTKRCVISFLDLYKKTIKNMSKIPIEKITKEKMIILAKKFYAIATKHNIEITTCAEKINLKPFGIEHGACIDKNLIEKIINKKFFYSKDKAQRVDCNCITSIDIGSYNTCIGGCLYCYANYDSNLSKKTFLKHNPDSSFL